MHDIVSTAHLFGIDHDTIVFCKEEFNKGKTFFNSDKHTAKIIKEDICALEESFVYSMIKKLSWQTEKMDHNTLNCLTLQKL